MQATPAPFSCYAALGSWACQEGYQTDPDIQKINLKQGRPAAVRQCAFKTWAQRLRVSLPDVRSRSALLGQRTLVMHLSLSPMEPLPCMSARANGGLEFHSS